MGRTFSPFLLLFYMSSEFRAAHYRRWAVGVNNKNITDILEDSDIKIKLMKHEGQILLVTVQGGIRFLKRNVRLKYRQQRRFTPSFLWALNRVVALREERRLRVFGDNWI